MSDTKFTEMIPSVNVPIGPFPTAENVTPPEHEGVRVLGIHGEPNKVCARSGFHGHESEGKVVNGKWILKRFLDEGE